MKKIKNHVLSAILVGGILLGCSDEFSLSGNKNSQPAQTATNSGKSFNNGRIISYPLDWEHINLMPIPPGYNGGNAVQVPWGSTRTTIDPNLLGDYQSANGWVLVCNTFNSTTAYNDMYFSLYNQYRGILRLYYYVPSTVQPFNSASCTQSLTLEGDTNFKLTSPILAFQNNEVVDWATKPQTVSYVQKNAFSNGTWYVNDWEMAYDPNLATQKFTNTHFLYSLISNSVTNLAINGTQNLQGTIDGQFGASNIDLTLNPSINSGNYGAGSIVYNGGTADDNSNIIKSIGSSIISGISSGLAGVATNLVSKLFSGVFGDNKTSPAHITLSGTMQMTGTLTNSTTIAVPKLFIPGTDTTMSNGVIVPINGANLPMGLFSLSAKPAVVRQKKVQSPYTYYVYSLQSGSYSIVWNPNLSNVANITNLTQHVILGNAAEAAGVPQVGGPADLLTLGNRQIYDGSNVIWFKTQDGPTDYLTTIWVRISFDVVPKNGSGTMHVVKTFKPTITISNTPYTGPLYQ